MSKQEENRLFEYIGDPDQLMTLHEATLSGGFQDGVRIIEISNGGHLSASILPDRCMDLYQVRYKGQNLGYIAPCGIVGPQYYDRSGTQWLRGFFVGLMTTCGLQHIGGPVTVDGEERGLHGRISYAPAENVKYERRLDSGAPSLVLEGTMREARLFGENLRLSRRLEFEYTNDCIVLTDTITNCGFGDRQFLYALHLNYGFPLLEEGAEMIIDSSEVIPRDGEAAKHLDSWQEISAPNYPYPERCYFHKLNERTNDLSGYTLFNRKRGIGVRADFDTGELPYFCQWKMLGKGEYVMGLEPMNAFLDGPKIGEPGCGAPSLPPGASKTYRIKLSFIDKL